ncbi:Atg16p TDEL_0G02840 [Torulaspora delbrueckii]|uniref:Autophagy-related protein 16 domain-containing protein n=1 Tax=Torulaspora delbrueckii TaxID=4950 RepID=G8ZXN4_TORDE|nr:hypothetical protein TDEL_0G02840 [Torulaspora delbrueckii]CCE93651.1 hypothetical protein TDEL_0G02840 [Torulaspora delbrueckii]
MDKRLIERLAKRDEIEGRYAELFQKVSLTDQNLKKGDASRDTDSTRDLLNSTIARLRKELKDKDTNVNRLKEVIEVKKQDSEKLNNEIISLTIENNLTSKRFADLEEEHDKLVKRWVARVQQDVDKLNAGFD